MLTRRRYLLTSSAIPELRRASYFTAILLIVNAVGDGWSGRPSPLAHQLLLLPVTAIFIYFSCRLLAPNPSGRTDERVMRNVVWTAERAIWLIILLQVASVALFVYEGQHFAGFGYHLSAATAALVFSPLIALLIAVAIWPRSPTVLLACGLACSAAGIILAIADFPLNYLRSDMLPVILWADANVLHHLSPYATMHVGARLYDFPYLPGMIVAYLPFVAAQLDIRWGSLCYLLALAALLFSAARQKHKLQVAALIGLFLVEPFLQYRHDLYLEPHWLTLCAAYVLMQRKHFAWAALIFGISMAVYQFSWILFPFFLLNAYRRRGWHEPAKLLLIAVVGALLIASPFLGSALQRIAHNAVGQWGNMGHALADPMNLSYWATYVIGPDKLLRLQAVLMIAIFVWAFLRGRCTTVADTLRCSIAALTVFVLLNSIVDGYFFLMLLVPMLLFTCIANNWLAEGEPLLS